MIRTLKSIVVKRTNGRVEVKVGRTTIILTDVEAYALSARLAVAASEESEGLYTTVQDGANAVEAIRAAGRQIIKVIDLVKLDG